MPLTLDSLLSEPRPCVCCGADITMRLDKKGRPFVRCPFCATLLFFKSFRALAGWVTASRAIEGSYEQHQQAILALEAELTGHPVRRRVAKGGESVTVATAMVIPAAEPVPPPAPMMQAVGL